MVNPYDTRPVWDDRFVGRKEIIDELLAAPANSLIIGARRIGKSSLLRHLQWLLEAQRIPAFCISLEMASTPQELTAVICRVFAAQKSRLDFAGIGFDLNQFRQADCLEMLSALDGKLNGQPFFLLFDEAEQLVKFAKNDPDFVSKLRGTLQSSSNLKSILAASPLIFEVTEFTRTSPTSSFFNGFNQILLSVLSATEAEELVRRPRMKVSDRQLEKIFEHTHFHPYFIQLLCNVLFNNGRLLSVTKERLRHAYRKGNLDLVFLNAFRMLSSEEKSILRFISQKGALTSSKLKTLIRSQKIIELSLANLIAYGHLKKTGKAYDIANSFLYEWLKTAPQHGDEIRRAAIKMDPKLCFVAMPFAKEFTDVYESAIEPAVKECGYECLRIDRKPTNKRITDEISEAIQSACFVIVDASGKNPNCYYEFGFAHACGRVAIPIIQEGEGIQFDVKDYQHIWYDRKNLYQLRDNLVARILGTIGHAPH